VARQRQTSPVSGIAGGGTTSPMRPLWTGTISFGLVSVPVRMYTATESKELKFHFLHRKDLTPIGYDKVRKDTGKHVDPEDIVRGFEIEKGKYVPLEDEDLDRVDVELTRTIDICDFVDLEEIDPIYFRKTYYLLPQDGSEKPYLLLVRALDETGKVAIAKVVIRKKQYLACIRPWEGKLLLETMYFADEVRKPEPVKISGQLRGAEVEMARALVENLSERFDPEKYDDSYRKELLSLIRKKAKGQKLPEPQVEEGGEVIDLMAALRESVQRSKRGQRKTRSTGSKRKTSGSKSKTKSSSSRKTSSKRKTASRKAS
jgi:DNA end-binding protein Ku